MYASTAAGDELATTMADAVRARLTSTPRGYIFQWTRPRAGYEPETTMNRLARHLRIVVTALLLSTAMSPAIAGLPIGKVIAKAAQQMADKPDTVVPVPLVDDSPISPKLAKPRPKRETGKPLDTTSRPAPAPQRSR